MEVMELLEFDLNKALNGATVVTRNGDIVTDLAYFASAFETTWKLRGVVNGEIFSWTIEGKWKPNAQNNLDLFIFEE